jgi:hypothetical protein
MADRDPEVCRLWRADRRPGLYLGVDALPGVAGAWRTDGRGPTWPNGLIRDWSCAGSCSGDRCLVSTHGAWTRSESYKETQPAGWAACCRWGGLRLGRPYSNKRTAWPVESRPLTSAAHELRWADVGSTGDADQAAFLEVDGGVSVVLEPPGGPHPAQVLGEAGAVPEGGVKCASCRTAYRVPRTGPGRGRRGWCGGRRR